MQKRPPYKVEYRCHGIRALADCRSTGLYEVRLPVDGGYLPLTHVRFIRGNVASQARALRKARAFVDKRIARLWSRALAEQAQIRAWVMHPQ
jgi:hypothetical protein